MINGAIFVLPPFEMIAVLRGTKRITNLPKDAEIRGIIWNDRQDSIEIKAVHPTLPSRYEGESYYMVAAECEDTGIVIRGEGDFFSDEPTLAANSK